MHLRWLVIVLCCLHEFVFCQETSGKFSCDHEMGDSVVTFVFDNNESNSPILFINLHENESTSIQAYYQFDTLKSYRFIHLMHGGTRRVFYNVRSTVYSIDPNRIFTNDGIAATLFPADPPSRKAKALARDLAHEILHFIKQESWIISLHNNTADNYSILSYLPDSSEAANTKDLFINNEMDPDDFIYTTNQFLFDELKKRNINVILQDNLNCINDGSLSVYCGKKEIRYANVEAEEGHLMQQKELIKAVVEIIEATL